MKDGGRFDSVAGATVTPRAVIKAVRKAAALCRREPRDAFRVRNSSWKQVTEP